MSAEIFKTLDEIMTICVPLDYTKQLLEMFVDDKNISILQYQQSEFKNGTHQSEWSDGSPLATNEFSPVDDNAKLLYEKMLHFGNIVSELSGSELLDVCRTHKHNNTVVDTTKWGYTVVTLSTIEHTTKRSDNKGFKTLLQTIKDNMDEVWEHSKVRQ